MKAVSTAQMKEIDETAIHHYGIPSLELMENAAGCVTQAALETLPPGNPHVLVLCGTGNNGGDGLACARQLLSHRIRVTTILAGKPEKQTLDSKTNAQALLDAGGKLELYSGLPLPECDLIVDAIFGFGLNREVGGQYRDLIAAINRHPAPVIACDIPSGLNGDTGEPMGISVRADKTVSFTCAKIGLLQPQAAAWVGKLEAVKIGIPEVLIP